MVYFFGQDVTVSVGGLVASGLDINSDDFMNGEFAFAAIEGTAGTVVNRGLINAATGGNVALRGKSVENHGLISANLGHVALASGSEVVVTFGDQELIGVRIDKETLAGEIGGDGAVNNAGTLEAKGGVMHFSKAIWILLKPVRLGCRIPSSGTLITRYWSMFKTTSVR